MTNYSAFEGDLVRPLGFVVLYASYAEWEICEILRALSDESSLPENWVRNTVGWKLSQVSKALGQLGEEDAPDLVVAIKDARALFDQRNELVHGVLFAGGRLHSMDPEVPARGTSVDEVAALAEALFNCRERLNVYRQKQLAPALEARARPDSE